MKRKIYVLPDSPNQREVQELLEQFNPPLNEAVKENALASYSRIQSRLRDAALSDRTSHIHQHQALSDGNHTVVFIGRLDPPGLLQRVMDWF